MTWWTTLTHPLSYAFFQKGLVVATISGALLALIGVYITLRGMSYIGHGLAHAIFGGFAASQLINASLFLWGAGAWGIASALAINTVTRKRGISADAAIGVITTSSFAIGVALLTKFGARGPSFDNALFGSILGISTSQLILLAVVALAAGAVVFFR
ncbi:MAG: metal ABC transporter permease, partial [Actinobacteria bacterium]|nr:metal ABC transporter permease [Actinomycetota bacterium]